MFFLGDSLGMHEMFEIKSPSAKCFCRICWIKKADFKANPLSIGVLREPLKYNSILEDKLQMNNYGVKANCIYNQLKDFHITHNYTLDLLHDFGEGVTQLLLNRVFQFCCKGKQAAGRNMISLDRLNERIQNFDYGPLDIREKPSEITLGDLDGNKVGQKAYQAFLLFRTLPCLIFDLFIEFPSDKTRHIQKIITLHSKILCIVMSTSIHKSDLEELDCLYVEFTSLFCALFNNVQNVNKLHYIRHYKDCIKKCGPARFYNTARFEYNHLKFKNKCKVCNCFKNITHTLMNFNALEQLNTFINPKKFELYKIVQQKSVEEMDYQFKNVVHGEAVSICSSLHFNNQLYMKNMYICIEKYGEPHFLPTFGKIKSMCVQNNKLNFYVEIMQTKTFSNIYFGFVIENAQTKKFIEVQYSNLEIKESFYAWTPINTNNLEIIYKKTLVFH